MGEVHLPYLDGDIRQLTNSRLEYLIKAIELIERLSNRMLEKLSDDIPGNNLLLALSARIYNHLLAGQLLLRKGLLTDALTCGRSAFEVTCLFQFLLEDEQRMKSWLAGRRYSPAEVREKSAASKYIKEVYDVLSKAAHPNITALETYAIVDNSSVSVSFGPRLPRAAVIATFSHLIMTATTFLGMMTTLLRATGEQELTRESEEFLRDVYPILEELKLGLV
jgi:hypothetical protein